MYSLPKKRTAITNDILLFLLVGIVLLRTYSAAAVLGMLFVALVLKISSLYYCLSYFLGASAVIM